SGVKELGIIEPVLTAYYRSSQPTNAAAIAIAAGGKQFVFKAKSEMQAIGRRYVEVVKAPLTAEGLAFIASLSSAESVNLRLCGSRVYTTEIKRGAANGIALVEAQSLNSSKAVFDIISPLMTGEYLLWDLSAGWWEAKNGFAPEYETADVISGDDYGIKYDKLGMLAYGDNTSASRSLQTMLVSAGFMYGTPTQNFNEETRTAVLGAQSYFGFIESGCVTPALVASISGKPAEKKADESAANDAQSFDGKLAVSIARAWLAKGASPVFGGDAAALKPINSDNLLLIADGRLVSAVLPELRLYRDLSAYFVCGDYKFEASLVCEANGGKSLITEALPLSDTRLVIYSEIPAPAAKLAGWKLVISYGDIEKTWELK
ncbi:MAG: peptidoglycan-binding protein, partial [Eubacteriales bacterium]|nr:peptidoglycan-binding protein [Eubacteriales bacterium]